MTVRYLAMIECMHFYDCPLSCCDWMYVFLWLSAISLWLNVCISMTVHFLAMI